MESGGAARFSAAAGAAAGAKGFCVCVRKFYMPYECGERERDKGQDEITTQ